MGAFLAALRFLTILPVPGSHRLKDQDWGRATAWYPAVGLVVGAALAGLAWLLGSLFPWAVAAALLLVIWVVLTGALHLDGFVDCCDALLAPVPPERRLEILRDVHTGAFGVVGAGLLLITKYAALAALPGDMHLPGLLLVPTLARWAMTAAVVLYPYARPGAGLGRSAKTGAGSGQLALATATALLVTALGWLLGLSLVAPLLLVVTAVTAFLIAQWIQSRIGGLTGDGLGAIGELAETVGLLIMVAAVYQGALP
jgi:adenosylcobinamide-GDP ribazoletransferase